MDNNEKIIELDQNNIENLDSDIENENSNKLSEIEELNNKLKKSKTKKNDN